MRNLSIKNLLIMTTFLILAAAGGEMGLLYAQCPPCAATPDAQRAVNSHGWQFTFTRPCSTQTIVSGNRGGGLQIENASFNGRTVFFKAHTPIFNVKYQSGCGPFRDWQYEESRFQCAPVVAAGRCNGAPTTNCANPPGGDVGAFCGVSVDASDPNQLVLTTMIRADWYRYQLQFFFYPDGTFHPAVRWTSTPHPCNNNSHLHQMYWRIDFDIEGSSPNVVEELNLYGPLAPGYWENWDPHFVENTRMREQFGYRWFRQRNPVTNRGYIMIPPEAFTGEIDGLSVAAGISDIWMLLYAIPAVDQEETNDCSGGLCPSISAGYWAHLHKYITQTSSATQLVNADLVLWYGASHFHQGNPTPAACTQENGPWFIQDYEGLPW